MDQQAQKHDSTPIEPPYQQPRKESNSEILEEQGEGRQGEVQNRARSRERGRYRQYEDSQAIIEKIRSYRTQRYPDSEIIKLLDNMPGRTYYNYAKNCKSKTCR